MSHHGCPERLSRRAKNFGEDDGQPTMEVLVETLTGAAFEMTVSPSDTVLAIKSKISRVEGIPVSQQHLVYGPRELEDGASLGSLGVRAGARLRLVLGLRGGPVSTRRLPPPPRAHRVAREWLLDTARDDGVDWSPASCKVTVLVFRDGEQVNLLSVMENEDAAYTHTDNSLHNAGVPPAEPPPKSVVEDTSDDGLAGSVHENAVTMGKMMELRRRMEALTLTRTRPHDGEKSDVIQKTRSEETLSVPSLLDDAADYSGCSYEADDTFAPLYDGRYTRYGYDCSFADRYALLPPIGARSTRDDRVKLSDALAGTILVKSANNELLDEGVCVDGRREHVNDVSAIPAEYTPMVGGCSPGWVVRGAPPGASQSAANPSHPSPVPPPLSSSTLQLSRAPPPLSGALFSSSTSDLEKLRRNALPALSRHRNTEHLHLSDERLDARPRPRARRPPRDKEVGCERRLRREEATLPPPEPPQPEPVVRLRCAYCRKRLNIATVHSCRCGGRYCAPHRYAEVHGCRHDYKSEALRQLARDNPAVRAPKLPEI